MLYLGWTSFQWARLPAWSANSMLQIPHVFNANGTNLFLPRFDVPFFSGFLSPLVDWNSKKNPYKIFNNQFLFLKLPYLWAIGDHLILLKCVTLKKIPTSICDCDFIIQNFAYAYFILQIHYSKSFKMRHITYLYISYSSRYA